MLGFNNFLTEKQIIINNGAKYGQIVFLVGGSASVKGFAISNFINLQTYKIFDVDEWKKAFIKLANLKNKFPEIKNADLKPLLMWNFFINLLHREGLNKKLYLQSSIHLGLV